METYLDHYLDLGLIADYYRYHDKKIPTGLSEFSSKTSIRVLQGKTSPASLAGKRSLALVYAKNKVHSDLIEKLMFLNENDVCFQIYAIVCEGIRDLVMPMLSQPTLGIAQIAIIANFAANKLFRSSVPFHELITYLQQVTTQLTVSDPQLLQTEEFNYICSMNGDTEISKYWHKFRELPLKPKSRSVKYFMGFGLTYREVLMLARKHFSSTSACSLLLDDLFSQCPAWNTEELALAIQLARTTKASCCISRYQNYETLYNSISFRPKLFRLCKFDQYTRKKLDLLMFSERLAVLDYTFRENKCVSSEILRYYPNEVQQVFHTYEPELHDAWLSCWKRLNGCYHPRYLESFLENELSLENSLEPFLPYLNEDTAEYFAEESSNASIRKSLISFCSEHTCFAILEEYKDFYPVRIQNKIAAEIKLRDDEQQPDNAESKVFFKLQPYAKKYNRTFDYLTYDQQVLLASVLNNDLEFDDALIKECMNVLKVNSVYYNETEILRAMLIYGSKWFSQIYHYYRDLNGYEQNFDPSTVCQDSFIYFNYDSTLEDAKYFRGRKFRRTRPITQEFSDNTLNFFQWCHTDAFDPDGLVGDTDEDFAKFFAKSVLHQDIDDWEIEDGSPLLDSCELQRIDWHKNPKFFCKSNTQFLIDTDLPEDLWNLASTKLKYEALKKNLDRKDLDWYKKHQNWEDIIVYDFEWSDDACNYADFVIRSGAKTVNDLLAFFIEYYYYIDASKLWVAIGTLR